MRVDLYRDGLAVGLVAIATVLSLASVGSLDHDAGDENGGELGARGTDSATTPDWEVNDLALVRDALIHAAVPGTVTMRGSNLFGLGTQAEVQYCSDQYQTLIVKTEEYIDGDLNPFERAVYHALAGTLRGWDDEQRPETVAAFDPERLLSIADKRVFLVAKLAKQISATWTELDDIVDPPGAGKSG